MNDATPHEDVPPTVVDADLYELVIQSRDGLSKQVVEWRERALWAESRVTLVTVGGTAVILGIALANAVLGPDGLNLALYFAPLWFVVFSILGAKSLRVAIRNRFKSMRRRGK